MGDDTTVTMTADDLRAVLAAERAAGIAEERARVVAWLRGHIARLAHLVADRIEAGAHMPETGGDLTTLRATCNDRPDRPDRSQRFDAAAGRLGVGKPTRDLPDSLTGGRCGHALPGAVEVDGRLVLPVCSSPAGHHGAHQCEFGGVWVEWPGAHMPETCGEE